MPRSPLLPMASVMPIALSTSAREKSQENVNFGSVTSTLHCFLFASHLAMFSAVRVFSTAARPSIFLGRMTNHREVAVLVRHVQQLGGSSFSR